VFKFLREEINLIKDRDPAARSTATVLFLYPGLRAVIYYRIAHWFWVRKHYFIGRMLSNRARRKTLIEIHPGATIGKGFFIDHGCGVVIGETTEIGDNVTIYQGATLGGTGKDHGKRHPTLGNNVMVGAGAKVLGPVNIGDNSKIAAGAVVLKDIPADCTAVGAPAKVVRQSGKKLNAQLDHVSIPDPIQQEFDALRKEIDNLKEGK